MSDLKVEVAKVKTITKHPNADRLDLITLEGMDWVVISSKDLHTIGEPVVYVPIDSLLPEKLENYLFPEDSKIKLSNHRVKTIKIRQCISQGMAVTLDNALLKMYPKLKEVTVGDDVKDLLEIVKYEPPVKSQPSNMQVQAKKWKNPYFKEYTDIQNFKYYPDAFEDKMVYLSEKLHGSSARFGHFPKVAVTLFDKIRKFFGILPEWEFCFASRRVQLQEKPNYKGFYNKNIYQIVKDKYNLKDLLTHGQAIYGEIVGPGIQSGYTYGVPEGDYELFVYDVQIDGKWLDYQPFKDFCGSRNLKTVPLLYLGLWNREIAEQLRQGDSTIGGQKIREGIVIKSMPEMIDPRFGRLVLKFINDDYLLSEQTDFH